MAAALLSAGLTIFGTCAQAEDIEHSSIGWWSIKYRATETINGCYAEALFDDRTLVHMALFKDQSRKTWVLVVANPKWKSWVGRKKRHTLWLMTDKLWKGAFSVSDDKEILIGVDLSIDFMNSVADASSLTIMNERQQPITPKPLNMKDSAAAIRAVVRCVDEHSNDNDGKPPPEPDTETTISGTGFFVAPNIVLTNDHVVRGCKKAIQVKYPEHASYTAAISGQDNANDLVLLHTEMSNISIASFRFGPRLGEPVATFGFPYFGVLSSSGNFTLGNITSLTGIKDDTRFLQVSTPIQPGNSGGPLLDMSGSVVGVVVSQLNAVGMMKAASSVPQNVNFAIQAPIVVNFLSVKGVTPKVAPRTDGTPALAPADVADKAKQFTVQIYCQGVPEKVSETAAIPDLAAYSSAGPVRLERTGELLDVRVPAPRAARMKVHRLSRGR